MAQWVTHRPDKLETIRDQIKGIYEDLDSLRKYDDKVVDCVRELRADTQRGIEDAKGMAQYNAKSIELLRDELNRRDDRRVQDVRMLRDQATVVADRIRVAVLLLVVQLVGLGALHLPVGSVVIQWLSMAGVIYYIR